MKNLLHFLPIDECSAAIISKSVVPQELFESSALLSGKSALPVCPNVPRQFTASRIKPSATRPLKMDEHLIETILMNNLRMRHLRTVIECHIGIHHRFVSQAKSNNPVFILPGKHKQSDKRSASNQSRRASMYGYEDITRETGWSWGSVRP